MRSISSNLVAAQMTVRRNMIYIFLIRPGRDADHSPPI
jgi:hypothetical protein